MVKREGYYDRIKLIVGDKLFYKTVRLVNGPFVSKAWELLNSCGISQYNFGTLNKISDFMAGLWGFPANDCFECSFTKLLQKNNEFSDVSYEISPAGSGDVIIAGGGLEDCRAGFLNARYLNVPVVMGALIKGGTSIVSVIYPDEKFYWDDLKDVEFETDIENRYFDWIDLNNQIANVTKAILLEGTEWERSDISKLLGLGNTTILCAHPSWPWVNQYFNHKIDTHWDYLKKAITTSNAESVSSNLHGKTVLIVGAGSLGSITANHFRILGASIVAIDGKNVSLYNPVRQQYPTGSIGKPKVKELVRLMCKSQAGRMLSDENCQPISETEGKVVYAYANQYFTGIINQVSNDPAGSKFFREILEKYQPDLVYLNTAYEVEFRLANILRKADIPHVVGRCYPRARWFEITAINGDKSPCFTCMQGNIYQGAVPTLTEEQAAIYDPNFNADTQNMNTLEAEPATRVESERCTDVQSRIGVHLIQRENRIAWLQNMMDTERICLIGGNHAEYNQESGWVYNIKAPGGASLFGVMDIAANSDRDEITCLYCGRSYKVKVHYTGGE